MILVSSFHVRKFAWFHEIFNHHHISLVINGAKSLLCIIMVSPYKNFISYFMCQFLYFMCQFVSNVSKAKVDILSNLELGILCLQSAYLTSQFCLFATLLLYLSLALSPLDQQSVEDKGMILIISWDGRGRRGSKQRCKTEF